LHETSLLPGLVAEAEGASLGLLQYRVEKGACEVVILISLRRREGIATALLGALRGKAEAAQWSRIWLVTTNNNQGAQAFYEAVGGRKVTVHKRAVTEARKLKPEIPVYDEQGVAIEDEIEYEWAKSSD
jgi:ribosomal protein S18 acetylase RimI-like enzyme